MTLCDHSMRYDCYARGLGFSQAVLHIQTTTSYYAVNVSLTSGTAALINEESAIPVVGGARAAGSYCQHGPPEFHKASEKSIYHVRCQQAFGLTASF